MAGPTRLPPIDECAADPSFVRFREGLLAAAGKHDVNGLMDALDEGVQIDFGGGQGKQAFRQKWFAVDADKDKIWSELTDALRLGCAIRDGIAIAPSFAAQLDPDADIYETVLAKRGAVVRGDDAETGKVLTHLDWDVLTISAWSKSGDSVEVKLPDGRTGFVQMKDIRTAADYRLTMVKRHGAWHITAFVAGD